MLGWLIQTTCAFYYQLYDNTFGRMISLFFPTFLFDMGKNTAQMIKKLIWFGFIFLNCYILSFFITLILFYRLLPMMDLDYDLNFIKTSDGFLASKVNFQPNLGLCAANFNEKNLNLTKFNIDLNSSCTGKSPLSLKLERQFYFCSLTLYIPNMEINHRLGNFEINFLMVDKYGDVITSPAKLTSIYQSKNRNFINKVMEFFWMKTPSTNMEIDVPLMENLPNNVMDIQAIFFEISERNILFEESTLHFKANIQGLRHYLYYWYWTSFFLALVLVANILFVVYLLIVFMDYLINLFVDNCCFCVKRRKKNEKESKNE